MAINAIATREQLTYIDNTVYSPKVAPLLARSLFSTINIGEDNNSYRYRVKTGTAKAAAYNDRATDIPVVDEKFRETQVPVTMFALAAEYSYFELKTAQKVGVNLLADQAQLVARGLAEYEDKLIFNGQHNSDPNMNIKGLTDKAKDLGVQEFTFSQAFDDATDNIKLRNEFQAAVGKITHLVGYAGARPTLMLPQARIEELNRPFNEYNPQITVLSMIQPWFDQIIAVPELEGRYWHHKNASTADKNTDMGYICLRTPEIAQIPLAMERTQMQPETHNMSTRIPYVEKIGGLAMRYPHAFVQLHGINDPNKSNQEVNHGRFNANAIQH